jgi:HD-like signal output (HDOD) protein
MIRRLLLADTSTSRIDLERALHSLVDQWELECADDAVSALDKLNHPFDAVVCDMKISGMSGLELLDTVQERYPQTIRVLLSDPFDRHSILSAAARTHQHLSKPFEIEQLTGFLSRRISLNAVLENESLKAFVSRMTSIPSLPALYTEVMDELCAEDPRPKKIGEIIARDIGMTAKILQVANSAFYATRSQITETDHAIVLLGLDTVQSLVLSLSIFSCLSPNRQTAYWADSLWQHSNVVGSLSRAIARAEGVPSSETGAYLSAGLLHDVGKLIIAACDPFMPRTIIKAARVEQKASWQIEEGLLGYTHAEVGAYLLGNWGLPFPIVEAVAWHHRPSQSSSTGMSPLAAVHVANALQAQPNAREPESGEIDMAFLERIGCIDKLERWKEVCGELVS